jgi:DNA-binding MarR family transcriptional regulator
MRGDAVDRILEQWRHERPDLDPSAKAITGRILRLASIIERRFQAAFAEDGLKDGDYGVLVALRRSGDPFELTPTALARSQMMTSGGMTAVIDRLERRALVRRLPNPDDRRGSLIRLTTDGRAAVDRAMARHVEAEHALVASLSRRERNELIPLLRSLLLAVDEGVADDA